MQRFGGRNRPPYNAKQTLCHRETNGFFNSLPPAPKRGGRFFVCGAQSYFFRGRPGKIHNFLQRRRQKIFTKNFAVFL